MKKVLKSISLMATISALLFTMPSCSNSNNKKNKEVKSEEQVQSTDITTEDADHHEHVYACPMHPEVTGKEGDKCSKCDMDLEMVEHEHKH